MGFFSRLLALIDRVTLWSMAKMWPLLTPEQRADIDARIKRYAARNQSR